MTEMTATPAMAPVAAAARRFSGFVRTIGGIAAIGVKELRGRMRGRRAFVILTIYLLLLGGFALMVETIIEAQYSNDFGGGGDLGLRRRVDRPGHLRGAAHAHDPPGRLPGAVLDVGRRSASSARSRPWTC